MNKTSFVSLYDNLKAQENKDIAIDDYISFVRAGSNQDLVLRARAVKQSGDIDGYKVLKSQSPVITGSCTFVSGMPKNQQNIKSLNGLIIIDIDNDQVTDEIKQQLENDPHTYIMHQSFGGGYNYCVFVKIDSNRFEDSFENLAQYYFTTYNISIDLSCRNKNRLRFLSYDPDIFVNDNAKKWQAKKPKTKEIKQELTDYVFFADDFDNILQQIKDRYIDLCRDDYSRWVNIGMSIAGHFGPGGLDKFEFICSFGSKYNPKTNKRHYEGFCNSVERVSIGTFYYYCKEAGLDIYTEKTKQIINSVTLSKSQGTPSVNSVKSHVEKLGYSIEETDEKIIQQLIESKTDYSRLANAELKEIEVLENFIMQRYEPKYNEIDQNLYINEDTLVDDSIMASIFLTCKKHLDLKKDLTERNVQVIMSSADVPSYNPILNFFKDNYTEECEKGLIKQYADCIKPYNPYNEWAFKKWLVGAVHNWTCSDYNDVVCPHTLVLTGSQHGVGKTSFMRSVLPVELRKYMKEDKIDIKEKDSMFRMGTSLMILDDEFGGKSVKDSKAFKNISDKDYITLRRPFQRFDITVRRRAILSGTTNEIDIIDDFDNRRILPVRFDGVDYEKMKSIDKTKLLCEAYYELLHGYDWTIIGDDKEYLRQNTESNVVIVPFDEIFASDFSFVDNGGLPIIVNQGDILKYYSDKLRITKFDIRNLMIRNKQENKSRSIDGRSKTGYKVWVQASNVLAQEWNINHFRDETPF